jgi:RND family efflux transporter MFP subunit
VNACTPAGSGSTASSEAAAPPVEAVPAREGALPLSERLSGVVKAHNQVAIRPEISAPIVEVLVRNGEQVERGQVLVRLQDDTPQDQLRQAEASLRVAEASAHEASAEVVELEAQVVRSRALAKQQLISDLDLETQEAQLQAVRASVVQAEARVDQARATVEERRSAIARTEIRAPVSGRVGQRDAEVGMMVDPGSLLFVVGSLDELIVEVPLTEGMLGYLREGQPVQISSKALGDLEVEATLDRISPFLVPGSFSTVGEIDVENGDLRLRPGMFVTVDVLYGESERATLVPSSALWEDPRTGIRGVFVVDMAATEPVAEPAVLSERAFPVEFRPVGVVAEGRGTAGIDGVAAGEWVVTVGHHLLRSDREAQARVRPTSWRRVQELQSLQREDLLEGFLAKQRRLAQVLGAEPPSNKEFLGRGAATVVPATTPGQ